MCSPASSGAARLRLLPLLLLGACTLLNAAAAVASTASQGSSKDTRKQLRPGGILPLPTSERCVFILGTGRSGSTSLADSLNQLPTYFIRGEQSAAFYHVYKAYQRLSVAWKHAFHLRQDLARRAEQQTQLAQDWAVGGDVVPQTRPPPASNAEHQFEYEFVKRSYSHWAQKWKLPWFNDLHPDRVMEAMRSMYTMMYGYHGPGVVSGFKEIRFGYFGKGTALRCSDHPSGRNVTYADFEGFVDFLRGLCVDTKILLNSRANASAEYNRALKKMTARLKSDAEFEFNLGMTHSWFDRYAQEHPQHSLRIVMENMFNPQTSKGLSTALLQFLGEDSAYNIKFDRMPTWTVGPETTSSSLPSGGQSTRSKSGGGGGGET